MYMLVHDILSYSKIDNEEIKFESVELDEVLYFVIDFLDVNDQVTFDDLTEVVCHKSQIQILFQNLIENGLKYNQCAIPSMKIINKNSSDMILIVYAGNGLGISPEDTQSIFDVFSILHSNVEYEGTCVGLSICKKIMAEHDLQILLRKSTKDGSAFEVTSP